VDVRELVRQEAHGANEAAGLLTDEAVAEALRASAARVRVQHAAIHAANRADYDAAAARLDAGTLDRLRLDAGRIEALAEQIEAMASAPPLEREIATWTLASGASRSARWERTSRRDLVSRSTLPPSC
jgi:gamma-glutamyl phosphate reductase